MAYRLYEDEESASTLIEFVNGKFPLFENLEQPFRFTYVTGEASLQNLLNIHAIEAQQHKDSGPKPLSAQMIGALERALHALFQLEKADYQTSVQMAYYAQAFCVITPDQSLLSNLIRSHITKGMKLRFELTSAKRRHKRLYRAILASKAWSSSIELPENRSSMAKAIYETGITACLFIGVSDTSMENNHLWICGKSTCNPKL
ncbi:hypothetical protein PtB15_6B733 [Puccinia triticina]|nr:hypothetical protein PtB15_6B733 [Puccinia triticina]